MAFPADPHARRIYRLLKSLRGRHLHTAYLLDARFRQDLEAEANFGASNYDDALITPDFLEDLEEMIARSLAAPAGRLVLGAPPPRRVMAARGHRDSKGTVLIIPGGAMAQLADSAKHPPQLLWLNLPVVLSRQFAKLRLDKYAGPDAEADKDKRVKIEPDGPLPCLYHSLEAALCADGWMTETFAYDWRKHIENRGVAYALKNLILARGTTSRPVHIVTHSQGGVVARAALAKLAQQITPHHGKSLVGEVIMLGPANYGSFDVALTIANSTEQIPVAKLLHNPRRWVQRVLASFTAFYQLMPWDENLVRSLQDPNHDVRLDAFSRQLRIGAVDSNRLHVAYPPRADPWGKALDTAASCFNDHITVIVGSKPFKKTPGGVQFINGHLEIDDSYGFTDGDGWVPDQLAIIPGTPAYRARWTGHIRLPTAVKVIDAVINILNGEPNVGLPPAN